MVKKQIPLKTVGNPLLAFKKYEEKIAFKNEVEDYIVDTYAKNGVWKVPCEFIEELTQKVITKGISQEKLLAFLLSNIKKRKSKMR